MKKRKTILLIILFIFIVGLIFNSLSTKTYNFSTYVTFDAKGKYKSQYTSMTNEFLAKAEKMHLKNKITSSNKYGVTMDLNFIQLKWLLLSQEMKNYYTSYDDVRNLTKGGVVGLELPS